MESKHKADEELKRKRQVVSSTSELDTSVTEERTPLDKQKKKKSKQKGNETNSIEKDNTSPIVHEKSEIKDLIIQMRQMNSKLQHLDSSISTINKKLENVMEKGDGSIRAMMNEMIGQMKESVVQTVVKSIEILEGKLFEREEKCDKIEAELKDLETKLHEQKASNENLEKKIVELAEDRYRYENQAEQYSRRNNINIIGLDDDNKKENALQTANKVINLLNEKEVCTLTLKDFDMAHRLPNKEDKAVKNRKVIVKFVSRYVKEQVMRNKRKLAGTGVFINEDLTHLNQEVLMSVKKKMKEEVKEAWSHNGKLLYKNMTDNIHVVHYCDYQHWLEMPWPKKQ